MPENHALWVLWFNHGLLALGVVLIIVAIIWIIYMVAVEIKGRIWGIRVH